jgi:hypothetical protein
MRLLLGAGLVSLIVLRASTARAVEDDLPVGKENPRVVPVVVADTYYAFHDPAPSSRVATAATTGGHHNTIAVNLIALGARLEHAKLTGTAVLHAGTSVDALYLGTPAIVSGSREMWKHIQLANVGWRAGDFHVEAGILPSLLGLESFVSTDNWNYARAAIADATPYYVTGLRATYRLAPTFTINATAFNGWDPQGDRNKHKSGQLRFEWRPSDKLTIADSFVAGAEHTPSDAEARFYRLYEELVVQYRIHTRVQLALQLSGGVDQDRRVEDRRKGTPADAHFVKNPMYYGAALWGRWQFADTTYVALRAEALDDPMGSITGRGAREADEPAPGQRILGGTATLGWQPHPRMLVRVEAMHRISNQPYYRGGEPRSYDETLGELGASKTFDSEARKTNTSFLVSAAFAY